MPREHEFVPDKYDYVCKHCGADAYDVSRGDVTSVEIQCLNWTDVPRVKRTPPRPTFWQELREFFGFKRK